MSRRGRPKTTGMSHNRSSLTYTTKQTNADHCQSTNQASSANGIMRFFTPQTDILAPNTSETPSPTTITTTTTQPSLSIENDQMPDQPHAPTEAETVVPELSSNVASKRLYPDRPTICNTDKSNIANDGHAVSVNTSAKVRRVGTDQRIRNIDTVLREFPDFVYTQNGFICRTCSVFASACDRQKPNATAFISDGSTLGDHPSDRLQNHLKTERHSRCLANEKQAKIILAQGGLAGLYESNYLSNVQKNRQYISHLILSLDYFIKHQIAKSQLSDFIQFLAYKLDESVTREFLMTSNNSNYAKYLTGPSVEELLTAYSLWCEKKIKESLSNNRGLTFFADESQSHNDNDEIISFLSWVDPNQVLGTLVPHVFLKLKSAADLDNVDSASLGVTQSKSFFDAKSVYRRMIGIFQEQEVDIDSVKFICFDGTNVMSGAVGGVQKLWKNDHPTTVYINCQNHRLALVFVHLKKQYQQIGEYDQLLLDTYLAIDYSKVAKCAFKQIQMISGDSVLKMVKACLTRWLSHFKASKRVCDKYTELLDTFTNIYSMTGDTKYLNISERLSTPEILCTILLMTDILEQTNKLSLMLQANMVNVSRVIEYVHVIKQFLVSLPTSSGYYAKADQYLNKAKVYRQDSIGHVRSARNAEFDKVKFEQDFVKPFCQSMVDELGKAFFDDQHPIVENLISLFIEPIHSSNTEIGESIDSSTLEFKLDSLTKFYSTSNDSPNGRAETVSEPNQVNQLVCHSTDSDKLLNEYKDLMRHVSAIKVKHQADIDQRLEFLVQKLERKKGTREVTPRKVPQYEIRQLEDEIKELTVKRNMSVDDIPLYKDGLLETLYPNMSYFLYLSCIMPLSNAISERGFSHMELQCSVLQASMNDETLDKLLRIRLFPLPLDKNNVGEIVDIFDKEFNKDRFINLH